MRPKVLWVEDSGRFELAGLYGPVLVEGRCDLTLAEDASTAVDHLLADRWDALIVDVRLPPGPDPRWRQLYREAGSDKVHAQLGLRLLYWLLRGEDGILPEDPPGWVRADRIGVFTVETRLEIGSHLDALGIKVFQQKVADLPDTILQQLITALLANA